MNISLKTAEKVDLISCVSAVVEFQDTESHISKRSPKIH